MYYIQKVLRMETLNLADSWSGSTNAVARHASFAQIVLLLLSFYLFTVRPAYYSDQ